MPGFEDDLRWQINWDKRVDKGQHLESIGSAVDPARRRKICRDPSVEDGDPPQRQPHRHRRAHSEVLGARVNLYMAAKKWDMVAAVASHLVKVDFQTPGWWISLAYALRCTESIEKAEAILLRAQPIHPEVAMIAFSLACYASVMGRMEEAKERLRHAINLDKDFRKLALDDQDLKPLWDWIAGLE